MEKLDSIYTSTSTGKGPLENSKLINSKNWLLLNACYLLGSVLGPLLLLHLILKSAYAIGTVLIPL